MIWDGKIIFRVIRQKTDEIFARLKTNATNSHFPHQHSCIFFFTVYVRSISQTYSAAEMCAYQFFQFKFFEILQKKQSKSRRVLFAVIDRVGAITKNDFVFPNYDSVR